MIADTDKLARVKWYHIKLYPLHFLKRYLTYLKGKMMTGGRKGSLSCEGSLCKWPLLPEAGPDRIQELLLALP